MMSQLQDALIGYLTAERSESKLLMDLARFDMSLDSGLSDSDRKVIDRVDFYATEVEEGLRNSSELVLAVTEALKQSDSVPGWALPTPQSMNRSDAVTRESSFGPAASIQSTAGPSDVGLHLASPVSKSGSSTRTYADTTVRP
ncbi:MAG: hypothetical protein O3C10_11660 [Chloroflexi bacterium]|nr:hypothetical protein [Chloroflexota bacterium]